MKKYSLLFGILYSSFLIANPGGDGDDRIQIYRARSSNPDWNQRGHGAQGELRRQREERQVAETMRGVVEFYRTALPQSYMERMERQKIYVDAHFWRTDGQLNASYRSLGGNTHKLQFDETPINGVIQSTCLSRQITAHEMGHFANAILQPKWCSRCRTQTGSFGESFGDLTAILYGLWDPNQQQATITVLHQGTMWLGQDIGAKIRHIGGEESLHDAVTCQVHGLSVPFTNAVFSGLREEFHGHRNRMPARQLASSFLRILTNGVMRTQSSTPSFSEVALSMLRSTEVYRATLGQHFIRRGILQIKYNPIKRIRYYTRSEHEEVCD